MTAAAAGAAAAGRAVRRFLGRIQTIRNLVQRFLRPAEQFIRPNLLKRSYTCWKEALTPPLKERAILPITANSKSSR